MNSSYQSGIRRLETDGKICDLIVFLADMLDCAREILRVLGHSDSEKELLRVLGEIHDSIKQLLEVVTALLEQTKSVSKSSRKRKTKHRKRKA